MARRAVFVVSSPRPGKNDDVIGLFYTDVHWRIDDVCDWDSWRWNHHAACIDTEPDAWFPNPSENVDHLARICAGCPVKRECLSMALEHDEWGYWGGTTREQRRKLLGGSHQRRKTH